MSARSSARNLFPPFDNPEHTIRRRSRTDPTLLNNSEIAAEGNGDLLVPDLLTMEELCQPSLNGQDAFYNGLTLRHHDTINAAAGGTFMKIRPEECYDLIENMTAHHNDWDSSAQWSESSSSITSSSDMEIAAQKAEMAKINKNLMRVLQVNQQVKAVTPNYETCGGPHSFSDCPATISNTQNVYAVGAYQGPPGFNQNQNRNNQNQNFHNKNRNQGNHNPQGNNQGRNQFFQGANQGQNQPTDYQAPAYQSPVYQAPVHQQQDVTTNEFTNFMKANDAILKNMKTNMTSLTNLNLELKNKFGQFMKMNTASSSGLGTLPGNTITNPKEDLKGITTQSGTAYQGPKIPTTSLPLVAERETEATKDMVHPTNNGSIEDLARTPLNEHGSAVLLKKLPEKLGDPDKFLIPCDFPIMAECLALADLDASINLIPLSLWNKLSLPDFSPTCMTLELVDHLISHSVGVAEDVFVKTGRDLIDVFEGELTIRVGKEAITFNLDQTSRYSANYNDMTENRIDVTDMACEEYSQEVLGFSDVIESVNPTPYY
nr:reverse transcriptase domain-containing protein [Tanacetum cinerariifolium]